MGRRRHQCGRHAFASEGGPFSRAADWERLHALEARLENTGAATGEALAYEAAERSDEVGKVRTWLEEVDDVAHEARSAAVAESGARASAIREVQEKVSALESHHGNDLRLLGASMASKLEQ